jgi:hypothetical protein
MARPSENIEYDVSSLKRSQIMTISILGIDIGKNSCSVVGVDDKGDCPPNDATSDAR